MSDVCSKCGKYISEKKGLPGMPINLCEDCFNLDPIDTLRQKIKRERLEWRKEQQERRR